jgi:hypothetical protein
MCKSSLALLCSAAALLAQADDEWEPFRKTSLFPTDSKLWLAPDMTKETMAAFTSRLLDGARQGDAKAMATLGRFFYVRGDAGRAVEWLRKAAEAGHPGAQFDFGTLCAQGRGVAVDLVEAYKWLWLATWSEVEGADAALRELSGKLDSRQMLTAIRRAVELQQAGAKPAPAGSGAQRFRSSSSK